MSDKPESNDATIIYRRLLKYSLPYWKIFVFAVIGMVIYAGTEVSFAQILEPMMDGGFVEKDPDSMFWVPILLVAIFAVRIIGTFLSEYGMAMIARNVIRDLRAKIFNKIIVLPTRYFDVTSSGTILSKMVYDIEQLAAATSGVVIVLIRDGITVIGLLVWMLYKNPLLTLILFVIAPFVAAIVYTISKRFRTIGKRIQSSMGGVTDITEESIKANQEIKIFGGQTFETQRFLKTNEYNRRQHLKLVATNAISNPTIQLMVAIAFAVMIFMATSPKIIPDMTAGKFVAFLMGMVMLLQHAKRLTTINMTLQRGIAAAESVFAFIDLEEEIDQGTKEIKTLKGKVKFDNVNFSYTNENEKVLSGITLEIKAGETVAFVGRSGAGKSTLVSLLPRFYDKTSGDITIDDLAIETLSLSNLRSHIALVSQNVTLFNDTVAHNIAYSDLEDVDKGKIRDAAKSANALEFIENLPDGFDTVVGEDGVLLSGGQRQRIAIARAIFKDAPVLILDEATSALDTESERSIQAALDELIKTRTTLVIAHRLSTIEAADKIVVLDKGKIVELGTHKELIVKNGHYAALHNMQFKSETVD
ncbi:MAG: lipid A export permease/ATP-binding protein MsbA [Gammaproteobacteria bacterium]|nr:lipid A export permease/ATP-binding protein MsbA [Gammaproteobacteria bacterium]